MKRNLKRKKQKEIKAEFKKGPAHERVITFVMVLWENYKTRKPTCPTAVMLSPYFVHRVKLAFYAKLS